MSELINKTTSRLSDANQTRVYESLSASSEQA